MYATGALDPNWWKYQALNHRWYRDDDAYADYREPPSMNGLKYLCAALRTPETSVRHADISASKR